MWASYGFSDRVKQNLVNKCDSMTNKKAGVSLKLSNEEPDQHLVG